MKKVLIVYYSRTGNTKKMAEYVKKGVEEENVSVQLKNVEETTPEDLNAADGIIIGSPTYYGLPAYQIKKLIDDSFKFHGKLEGKVGGAFTSAANIGGGNESTIVAIFEALLIHGMIIKGTSKGDHYGPVAIGAPDDRVIKECVALGKRVAKLLK